MPSCCPAPDPVPAELLPGVLDFLGRGHDRPFFLSVGLFETHTMPDGGGTFGYPGDDDRYVAPPAGLPSTAETRSDIASFRAAASVADDAYGQILDAIDAAGLRDTTLVVITTDHGVALPGMKGTLTDAGTGVLLIMRGPGGFDRWPAVRVPGLPDRPVPDLLRAARDRPAQPGCRAGPCSRRCGTGAR